MGLKTAVNNAVKAGFNALGASSADGLQTSITYTQVTPGSYNTTTGKTTNTETDYTIDIIFYKVRDREVDGIKIKINDIRVIFPQDRLSFPPSANDYITLNSRKMEIIQVQFDPSNSVYILFVRGV